MLFCHFPYHKKHPKIKNRQPALPRTADKTKYVYPADTPFYTTFKQAISIVDGILPPACGGEEEYLKYIILAYEAVC